MTAMQEKILSAQDVLGCGVQEFVQRQWERGGKTFPLPVEIDRLMPIHARVNAAEMRYAGNWAGRWIISCDVCGGAEYADLQDARFFCNSCLNVTAGGKWRPVVFPDVRAVEDLLLQRPARYRNFEPGETVADLRLQNAAITAGAV